MLTPSPTPPVQQSGPAVATGLRIATTAHVDDANASPTPPAPATPLVYNPQGPCRRHGNESDLSGRCLRCRAAQGEPCGQR
jgi:hypothetical protein